MSDSDDLEELRRETESGDRLDEAVDDVDQDELVERTVEALDAIDHGETQKTISIWDGNMAALFQAFDDLEEWETLGEHLREDLDVEGRSEPDRPETLRLLLRAGIPDEYVEALSKAVAEHSTRGL